MTDTTATVTWPAAKRGLLPVRATRSTCRTPTASRLAGHTTGTTLALTGLTLGTRYTVTVVAKDLAGAASWSSPPTAFVTGTPATSTCAVRLTNTADWGNGYVGSVDITNTGTEPIDGWTLGFPFPRAWQSFGSGWNANWTRRRHRVAATNVDWNAAIAPGATINSATSATTPARTCCRRLHPQRHRLHHPVASSGHVSVSAVAEAGSVAPAARGMNGPPRVVRNDWSPDPFPTWRAGDRS